MGNSFIYKGCNTHRIPCSFQSNNILLGLPISTNNNCAKSNDQVFLNLIPRVSKFSRTNNDVTFLDPSSQPVFKATVVVSKPELASGIATGSYATQSNPVDVTFGDNSFFFNDCNTNNLDYSAKNSGDFNS